MSGIMIKEVNEVITFYRPYTVEKRRLRSLVNFKVISEHFYNGCLEEFKNREHRKAIDHNRKINLIGGN